MQRNDPSVSRHLAFLGHGEIDELEHSFISSRAKTAVGNVYKTLENWIFLDKTKQEIYSHYLDNRCQ